MCFLRVFQILVLREKKAAINKLILSIDKVIHLAIEVLIDHLLP